MEANLETQHETKLAQEAPLSESKYVEKEQTEQVNKNEQKEKVDNINLNQVNRSESMNTPTNIKSTQSPYTSNNKAKQVYTPQYGSGVKKAYPHSSSNFAGNGSRKYLLDSPNRSSTFKNLTEGERVAGSNIFSQNQFNFAGGNSQISTQSNFMSASSLRQSTTSITFPKAERFTIPKLSHSGIQYDLPTVKDQKATSFGYGEKRILPQYLIKNAEENPSPAKYATHRSLGSLPTAKSFGLAYSYYSKTYIPKVTIKEPEASRDIPGVGQYEVTEKFAQNKAKYSFYGKGIVFQDMFPKCSPPCNQYSPNEKLTKSSRFSDPSFGYGQKYDFTKVTKVTPGPGAYVMPSAFDKYKNQKHRIISKSQSRINQAQVQ
ncbi:hypothetical protein ABPG74_022598 [Tetrahymena malaccensis]